MNWAEEEMQTADLGDERLNVRVAKVLERLGAHPGSSIPAACRGWAVATAARIGHNKAAVALANKLVRICWAVWCHERCFSGDWQSSRPA